MSRKKMLVCSVCGTPAPKNPERAGWLVRGHGNLVCPDCTADARLKATNRGGSLGFVKSHEVSLNYNNDSISASGCQAKSADFIAIAEAEFAEGARRVRFV